MESGAYNCVKSHHDIQTRDKSSQALLYNTFVAPMPYWPSHSLHHLPNLATRGLQGGALQQVLDLTTYFTPKQLLLINSNRLWITKKGELLDKLGPGISYRSSPLSSAEAAAIAERFGAPASSSSDEYEDAISSSIADAMAEPTPSTSTPNRGQTIAAPLPPEPACRSKISVIPCVSVKSQRASFQAGTPTTPPKSKICIALEAHMAESKTSTQPLVNLVMSPHARDISAVQLLLSFMSVSNASHIDTVPVLRRLLYVYGHPDNVYRLDKLPNHFVRREDLTHTPTYTTYVQPRDQGRHNINVMCCTLDAFASHIKGRDVGMANRWPVSLMDNKWTAVPITSDMVIESWITEYTLTFLTSEIWAGRLSRRSNHVHRGVGGNMENTSYTTIPKAHNVHIPGPTELVLVLVDESITVANRTVPMLRQLRCQHD
ncbi:hypothetical protein RR48_08594 [Papilio machaon]|uniref:Uncharacterized protein n=1 Tax=Papilio machaon TaxID=76193 RepID=A0A194RHV2_PAPMA|nr:hypothetical protein RR48_08594 [Papilio machaon]